MFFVLHNVWKSVWCVTQSRHTHWKGTKGSDFQSWDEHKPRKRSQWTLFPFLSTPSAPDGCRRNKPALLILLCRLIMLSVFQVSCFFLSWNNQKKVWKRASVCAEWSDKVRSREYLISRGSVLTSDTLCDQPGPQLSGVVDREEAQLGSECFGVCQFYSVFRSLPLETVMTCDDLSTTVISVLLLVKYNCLR